MANVSHAVLTDPVLHEPKGASTASAGMVYVADGAGSGDWRYIPHAACYYTNIGTGTTYTTPTSYTLVNPVTVADASPHGFTHNSAGRLTYTGADTIDVSIHFSVTAKMSAGSVEAYWKIYKSGTGVTGTEMVGTLNSTTYEILSVTGHFALAQNEYVELYAKAGSGNIVVHALTIIVAGFV